MKEIFLYIFETISSILEFLDFNLPGMSLSVLDFIIIGLLVPLLFKFVKGSASDIGSSYGFFGELGGKNNVMASTKSIMEKNYIKNKEKSDAK